MEKFKRGDKVRIISEAIYQRTQEKLNSLTGIIVNIGYPPLRPYIYVKIDGKPGWGILEFSKEELKHIEYGEST